jgi:uncharacterized protein (TIRG00374 family)
VAGRPRASTLFNLGARVFGAIGLVVVIDQLGGEGIRRVFLGVGRWFVVIAAIDVVSAMCDAVGIHGFLLGKAPYLRVFAAQISGLAINRLTPGNSLGEPVKVTMLVRSVPTDAAVSAVVMYNLTTMYVAIATIALGVPVTALLLDLPHRIAVIVWLGLAALVVFAIVVAVLVRRGALTTFVHVLARANAISTRTAARWHTRVAAIDERIRGITDAKSSGLSRGLTGVIASRALNSFGTVVLLHACGIPMTAPLVVAMLSAGILVQWISNVVPLGLGIADSTTYLLYALVGAPPMAGVVYAMANRVRTVVLASIGLAVMAVANAIHRRNSPVSDPSRTV